MVIYWCENCTEKRSAFNMKTIFGVLNHLRTQHSIPAFHRRDLFSSTDGSTYSCEICSFSNSYEPPWGLFYKKIQEHIKKHHKYYIRFEGKGKPFRSLPNLLRFIDKKYDVHIGYIKGITKKVLFMDGIDK